MDQYSYQFVLGDDLGTFIKWGASCSSFSHPAGITRESEKGYSSEVCMQGVLLYVLCLAQSLGETGNQWV